MTAGASAEGNDNGTGDPATTDGDPATTDGGTPSVDVDTSSADEEAMASFEAAARQGREAVAEFRRAAESTDVSDTAAPRAVAALLVGLGAAFVYEYFVLSVAQILGASPGQLRQSLTVALGTQDLLLILVFMTYVNLFVSMLALRRAATPRPPRAQRDAGPAGEAAPAQGTGGSRKWWGLNMLVCGAAGYVLLVSQGTVLAGLGLGLGLFVGDELYRRLLGAGA